jgi:hypothetical protein
VGPSCQAPEQIPNPRVRVMQWPPSPSLTPPAYWSMEPSDPATSPRSRQEPPCAIHSMGPCLYPVVQRQSVLSSPGMREGEEGVTDVDDVVEVTVAEEEDDDEPVEVILVPDPTPPQLAYKQTSQIRIGPRGQPTRTLALRTGAREVDQISSETRSEVWLPPPPSPPGRALCNEPPPPPSTVSMTPPPLQQEHITPPPLLSPIGGHILR